MTPATLLQPATPAAVPAPAPEGAATGNAATDKAAGIFAALISLLTKTTAATVTGENATEEPTGNDSADSKKENDKDGTSAAAWMQLAVAGMPVPIEPKAAQALLEQTPPATKESKGGAEQVVVAATGETKSTSTASATALVAEPSQVSSQGNDLPAPSPAHVTTEQARSPQAEAQTHSCSVKAVVQAPERSVVEAVAEVSPTETATEPLPAAPVGTASAKQDVPMKMAEKTERSSRPAEKNLPQGNVLPKAVERSPAAVEKSYITIPKIDPPARSEPDSDKNLSILASDLTGKPQATENQTRPAEARPVRVEQAFTGITERVVSFKQSGIDSLTVRLKPDRDTEINLQLNLRHGEVEVVARVERGQFENLQARWGELQQTLAQQGVRVEPLRSPEPAERAPNAAATGNDFEQSSGHRGSKTPELPEHSEARATVALPGRRHAAGGARSAAPASAGTRGWESWA